jgi:DNA mismatch repair protein MutL
LGRIHVLPDSLINRIAAGEVVERPASVVKELVENSLDADARSVAVDCDGGGRRRIRVVDDGRGMDRDDALLALERHATSKLDRHSNLDSIATLGFRGEALSSIASVSRFVLSTSTTAGEGTEIEVEGGRIRSVREAGLPRGTSVVVERLFFNVPARRKFLRAEATELGHIARLMTRCALAYPERRFGLDHAGRTLLQVDPASGLDERISQIYGREFAQKLLPIDRSYDQLRIFGYAGRPAHALARRDGQHLFVNGRAVQDRVLLHAVAQAFGNTVPRGRYPSLFLFIDCDPSWVDVNVHPQKTEVRFRESSVVHDRTRDAIVSALSDRAVVPELTDLRPGAGVPASGPTDVSRALVSFLEREEARGPLHDRPRSGPGRPTPLPALREPLPFNTTNSRGAADLSTEIDAGRFADPGLVALAQYRDSYILAQDERGLVLVDQHAAHERVLFERFLAEASENRVEVQRLLFPLTIELPPAEMIVLEQEIEEFRRLGFVIEPFGGNSVRLDGIPALGADLDPEGLLRELLGQAAQTKAAVADTSRLRHDLVTSAACQAAIKINHPLAPAEMTRLLHDLHQTVSPSTCPHGRPLIFRLSHDEIERAFRRR